MQTHTPILYLVLFCLSCTVAIYLQIATYFKSSFEDVGRKTSISWSFITFFIGTCLYRIADGLNIVRSKKITQFDYICLIIHNCFALIQLGSAYVLFYLGVENKAFQSALLLVDWSLMPFFLWIMVWTRFLRRGWSSTLGRFALAASTFGHYLCLIHPSFFYFLLGISTLLTLLALYETYKIHFYRSQVSPIFFALLFLFPAFYLVRLSFLLNWVSTDHASTFTYIYLTFFTLITALANKLHLRILIDVNEFRR